LTSIALRHSSAVRSGKRVDSEIAALLTRMSIRPKRSSRLGAVAVADVHRDQRFPSGELFHRA